MPKKTEEDWVTIDDTNIVAYLHYCGFKFNPYKKGNEGRIGLRGYRCYTIELLWKCSGRYPGLRSMFEKGAWFHVSDQGHGGV
jgi:hypothetical protein